ncbi:ImmA/IrrE family metallo-endopeptidase [Alkalihalophilus marmarensis]|uniref:ImmA/IrrE family metallo-endopeptidase n=1 Tax=Alkalihalophilus marmarensis TaxID=521377 RepID=UPI002DB82287|nr:ImmA/IrrE family metallo-endopeptidase [Alkalihalophilus marmarensis]MEC2073200.1 ImmA/IrrE family metallo-endopeptidase [Alkalihalophilus marmarensis]
MRFVSIREEKVEKKYKQLGLQNPHDLTIENISSLFKIKVEYHERNSDCFYNDNCAYMWLKKNQPYEDIRADFFHEMGHFIDHSGKQSEGMPIAFEKLQEAQAHWLSIYLSMPRYIFEPIMTEHPNLQTLKEIFQIPEPMIRERIRIIRQQNTMHFQFLRRKALEENSINRTLQKGKVYKTTIQVLKQLETQVGKENLSYEIKSLLRRDRW